MNEATQATLTRLEVGAAASPDRARALRIQLHIVEDLVGHPEVRAAIANPSPLVPGGALARFLIEKGRLAELAADDIGRITDLSELVIGEPLRRIHLFELSNAFCDVVVRWATSGPEASVVIDNRVKGPIGGSFILSAGQHTFALSLDDGTYTPRSVSVTVSTSTNDVVPDDASPVVASGEGTLPERGSDSDKAMPIRQRTSLRDGVVKPGGRGIE